MYKGVGIQMRKHSPSFEALVEEYKVELMSDEEALDEIEKRIEDRQAKIMAQHIEADLKQLSSDYNIVN